MTTKHVEFVVTGDPARARATAERALAERKFDVCWRDEWSGVAERGHRAANIAFGALAQHCKVGVTLLSADPGRTVVRIERLSSGWAGGVIGARRTRNNLASLQAELEAVFASAGVLSEIYEG